MKSSVIILAASLLGSTIGMAQQAPASKTHAAKTTAIKTTTKTNSSKTMGLNIPAPVNNAFHQKFPQAEKVKWEKENAHEYEANFVMNSTLQSANFNDKGAWRETEVEIKVSELPQKVTESIKARYPGNQIVSAAKIELADKSVMYEADLKKGALKKEVLLKPDGSMVQKRPERKD
jgi:hypothetical protein